MWDHIAYAARYGHQPLDVILTLPIPLLVRFNHAVNELIRTEADATREAAAGGGD